MGSSRTVSFTQTRKGFEEETAEVAKTSNCPSNSALCDMKPRMLHCNIEKICCPDDAAGAASHGPMPSSYSELRSRADPRNRTYLESLAHPHHPGDSHRAGGPNRHQQQLRWSKENFSRCEHHTQQWAGWTWLRRDRPRAKKNRQHHDELVLFEESLRQIEDHVVLCEKSWAKKMVYPEAARLPLRGRQQIRQSLRVERLVELRDESRQKLQLRHCIARPPRIPRGTSDARTRPRKCFVGRSAPAARKPRRRSRTDPGPWPSSARHSFPWTSDPP